MYNIEFKGQSSENLGIVPLSLGRRQRSMEKLETYPIPDSNQDMIEHTGFYEPYEREVLFYAPDRQKHNLINAWLRGYGKLRTSIDPGGYFKAHVVSGLGYEKFLVNNETVSVVFKINPGFFYLESGDTPIPLTVPSAITNLGTHIAEPYIKITGTGNIILTINSTSYSFTAVDGYIEIDSELKYVYKDTLNQGDKMVGEFPILELGINNISWSGTVTNIQIIPRWREL